MIIENSVALINSSQTALQITITFKISGGWLAYLDFMREAKIVTYFL